MTKLGSFLRGALVTVAFAAYAASAAAQCEVTGSTVICPNSTVTLCVAPSAGYRWVDDQGNVLSTSQCLTVSAAGTYRVYTYDAGFDVWWGPCLHTVSDAPPESCSTEPPPPPPPAPEPTDTLACPRPANWWARQCRVEGLRDQLLTPDDLAQVSACADERSTLFAWPAGDASLCRLLRDGDGLDLRRGAHRQYAAVLANLCASNLASTQLSTRRFGVGAGAHFQPASGAATTVGAWASAADDELGRLEHANRMDRGARAAYRRIFFEAWAINHGVGLDLDCPTNELQTGGEAASAEAELGALADAGASLAPVAMPNPFSGSTRFAFTVSDPAGADVNMSVFDVAGRRMATVAQGHYGAGSYVVMWDGRALDGSRARSGMYFVRGRIGGAEVVTSVMKVE